MMDRFPTDFHSNILQVDPDTKEPLPIQMAIKKPSADDRYACQMSPVKGSCDIQKRPADRC